MSVRSINYQGRMASSPMRIRGPPWVPTSARSNWPHDLLLPLEEDVSSTVAPPLSQLRVDSDASID